VVRPSSTERRPEVLVVLRWQFDDSKDAIVADVFEHVGDSQMRHDF
jgi:hypothetical protein